MKRKELGLLGAAIALVLAFTLCAGLRSAAASTVVCEGTIASSSNPSVLPTGHFVSVATSNIIVKGSTKDCIVTQSSVTEVVDGSCGGSSPCVIKGTTTAAIPLLANPSNPACVVSSLPLVGSFGPGEALVTNQTGALKGCQILFTIAPTNKSAGAVLLQVSPTFGCSLTASGISTCVSNP